MVIKVYMSGNSGNKEIVTHQQRIFMILNSLGIECSPVDIAGPGMEEARDFMRGKGKKKDNERNVLPPQIFNDEKYCGDYDDFDLANEDDVLEEFLGIPRKTPLGGPKPSEATDEDPSKLEKPVEETIKSSEEESPVIEKSEPEKEDPPIEETPPLEDKPPEDTNDENAENIEDETGNEKESVEEETEALNDEKVEEEEATEDKNSAIENEDTAPGKYPNASPHNDGKSLGDLDEYSKKKNYMGVQENVSGEFAKGTTKNPVYTRGAVDSVKKSPGVGFFDESEERKGNCGFQDLNNAKRFWKVSQMMGTP